MDAFLPSEIGRLIYGYLFQQCGEGLADEFLNSCDSMRECRLLKQKYAKNFHHRVQDLSLEDILNQYSVLCSLIFKQATGEEPVHRNALGLLKKVLGSRLLGFSSSSGNRSRVAKPNGSKVEGLVGDKVEVIGSGAPVAQSGQPATCAGNEVDKSAGDEIGASVAEAKQQANPVDEDVAVLSPGISDAGDYQMEVDDNDFSLGDTLAEDALSNVAKESAPAVSPVVTSAKNISPNSESRICAILSNSALLEERARQPAGVDNLPFPAEYCTPRKHQVVASVPMLLATHLTKTPTVSSVVSPSKTDIKSVEDVSKSSFVAPESGLAKLTPAEKGVKREKVLQRGTNRLPSKSVTKLAGEPLSRVIPTVETNDHLVVTTPSTSVVAITLSTPLLNPCVPATAASVVHQKSRVSATPSPVADVQGAPKTTMVSANPNIPEERTESIFGELSFESGGSSPSKLDRSSTSMKSDNEVVGKLPQSPIRRSPRRANGSRAASPVSAKSPVTIAPVKNSTASETETAALAPRKSATEAEVLADSDETASTSSRGKGIPWDVRLRMFIDEDSPMDAHITKRKPKDPRNRKPKEVAKKRKHDDSVDDPLSVAKRFRSETIAAVPVSVATARQPLLVGKSVDASRNANRLLSPPRRQHAAKEVESTHELVERKGDRSRHSKGGLGGRVVPEAANRGRVESAGRKLPEAANASRSSMTNLIDLDSPAVEKRKAEHSQKVAAVDKKKQPVAKESSKEVREAVKARGSAKKVAPAVERAANSSGVAKGRKRSERIEDRVPGARSERIEERVPGPRKADPKSAAFREPILPQPKEKPTSSPRESPKESSKEAKKSHQKAGRSESSDRRGEDYDQSMVTAVQPTSADDSGHDDPEADFEMVLEVSPVFDLYYRSPKHQIF